MNRFTSKMTFVAIVAMLFFALATSATAESISHIGQTDPASVAEGWTFLGTGIYTVGPGGNDGQDYWPINASNQTSGYVGYRASGATVESILADTNGWFMTATVKLVTADPTGDGNAPFFGVRDHSNWWQLSMIDTGNAATTGLYIQDETEAFVLVEAVDVSAYNTYKMVYDPAGGTAGTGSIDVTVNGGTATTYARADVFAYPNFVNVNFGDFNSTEGGSVSRWNHVEFGSVVPVPEPSIVLMLAAGLIMLAPLRKRS